MGRSPCCPKEGLNRGAWTPLEDKILTDYITSHAEGKWRSLPKRAGLKRCGKSCRLRWLNYLRPDIKRGNITPDEADLIIRLHKLLGNRWSLIAGRLPGRTDNEIKNYWNTNIGKKLQSSESSDPNHQPSANSTAKKSSRSKKPPQKASPVVRTKASRCSKVHMNSDLQPPHNQQFGIMSQVKVASAPTSSEDTGALFIQPTFIDDHLNSVAPEGREHCLSEIDMSMKKGTSLSSQYSTGEYFRMTDYMVDMSFLNGFLGNEFLTPTWNEDVIGTQVCIGHSPNLNVIENNICSPNLSGTGLWFSGSHEHESHVDLKVDAELGSMNMLSFLDSCKSLDWINQYEPSN